MKGKLNHIVIYLFIGSSIWPLTNSLIAQDRNIQINEVYPPEMFKENGGRFINVKNLVASGIYHTNAVGNGEVDDSDAIIAAMDWIMKRLNQFYKDKRQVHWHEYWQIYFPDGIYRITKPLVYSEKVIDFIHNRPEREGTSKLFLVGQSRENTIIKLDDNLPDFQKTKPTPVVSFSKFDEGTIFNNMPASFQFRNFTIDTGNENPQAVGLDFYGANMARLDNLLIKGNGHIGLHIRIGSSHGYHSNITVDGFQYGMYFEGNQESHPVFEYISLKNQMTTAIYMTEISASFRKINSQNEVPGIRLEKTSEKSPHMVIIDSDFKGGIGGNTAIDLKDAFLFARNISVEGYESSLTKDNKLVVSKKYIHEYISHPITSFNKSRYRKGKIKSMNLPILDYPLVAWVSNFDHWVNVDDYGAIGDGITDDCEAIQNALNSGRAVVYLPKKTYLIEGIVTIPATVQQIIGSSALIKGSGVKFDVNEYSEELLLFHQVNLDGGTIRHSTERDLLFESTSSASNLYESKIKAPGTKLFINNTHGFARDPGAVQNINVWNRWNNNEKKEHWQFNISQGANLWMMGFKSEKTYSVFRVEKEARLEVLGGILNRYGDHVQPSVVGVQNNDSHISIIMSSNGPDRNWQPMIRDEQNGKIKSWDMNHFPDRGWDNNIIIPLYISYD